MCAMIVFWLRLPVAALRLRNAIRRKRVELISVSAPG
jgi:hypothetical protein